MKNSRLAICYAALVVIAGIEAILASVSKAHWFAYVWVFVGFVYLVLFAVNIRLFWWIGLIFRCLLGKVIALAALLSMGGLVAAEPFANSIVSERAVKYVIAPREPLPFEAWLDPKTMTGLPRHWAHTNVWQIETVSRTCLACPLFTNTIALPFRTNLTWHHKLVKPLHSPKAKP